MTRRTFELVDFADIRRERVRWLFDSRVPRGMLTVLTGMQGDGKSMWTCSIAAMGSRGELPGDLYGEEFVTLMVALEDSQAAVIKPRLQAAQANLRNIKDVSVMVGDSPDALSLPRDMGDLRRLIVESGARLLVLDPITAILGDNVNAWKSAEVRRVLTPLGQLAEETDCAILAIVHPNKNGGTNALQRIADSAAFTQVPRSTIMLGRDPNEPKDSRRRFLAHVKCNVAAEQPTQEWEIVPILIPAATHEPEVESARIRLVGESGLSDSDMFSQSDPDQRTQTDDAVAFLLVELADGRRPALEVEELAKRRNIADKPLRSARERLGVTQRGGGVERDGFNSGAWYWKLPTAVSALAATQRASTASTVAVTAA